MSSSFGQQLLNMYMRERELAHEGFNQLSGANAEETAQAQAAAQAAQAAATATAATAQAGALVETAKVGAVGLAVVAVAVVAGLAIARKRG